MLRESGRVVAVEDKAVWVETIRSSLCGSCAARAGCGNGVLARASRGKGLIRAHESHAIAALDCSVNDVVDIELPESAVLRGSLWVYGMPLAAAIIGALVGDRYSESMAMLGFVMGLITGFCAARIVSNRPEALEVFEPRLVALRKVTGDTLAVG